jgi:hypothetical protein
MIEDYLEQSCYDYGWTHKRYRTPGVWINTAWIAASGSHLYAGTLLNKSDWHPNDHLSQLLLVYTYPLDNLFCHPLYAVTPIGPLLRLPHQHGTLEKYI